MISPYRIDTERFITNAQIAKIGEFFADCIQQNYIQADAIVGLAYHGIAFSAAAACSLYQKYGVTVNYCHDRQLPDSRGRNICGYTLKDGDRVIIADDLITSGKSMMERIEKIRQKANVIIEAIVVIANRNMEEPECSVQINLEEKYGTKIYSVISHEDIVKAMEKHLI